MLKLAWITPRWPVPESDGAKVATAQALRSVTGAFDVSVLAIPPASENCDVAEFLRGTGAKSVELERRRLEVVFGSKALGHLLRAVVHPTIGITFSAFTSSALRASASSWLRSQKPDVVLFDGLHAAAAFDIRTLGYPCIYRAHNVEADLWRSTIARGSLSKFLAVQQCQAVERFETLVVNSCALTLAVSGDDAASFRRRSPNARVEVVRIGVPFGDTAPERKVSGQLAFGFLGRPDWAPNREGLDWLVESVWPEVARVLPQARLLIAGSGHWPEALKARISSCPGAELLGQVAKLEDFYGRIDALLVPIFSGSGTRVKAIEACRFATACVSTEIGVAGIGLSSGEEYVAAQTPAEWVQALTSLERDQLALMGRRAWARAKSEFDLSSVEAAWHSALKSVAKAP